MTVRSEKIVSVGRAKDPFAVAEVAALGNSHRAIESVGYDIVIIIAQAQGCRTTGVAKGMYHNFSAADGGRDFAINGLSGAVERTAGYGHVAPRAAIFSGNQIEVFDVSASDNDVAAFNI